VATELSENKVTGRVAVPGSSDAVDRGLSSLALSDAAAEAKTAATSTSHDSRTRLQLSR